MAEIAQPYRGPKSKDTSWPGPWSTPSGVVVRRGSAVDALVARDRDRIEQLDSAGSLESEVASRSMDGCASSPARDAIGGAEEKSIPAHAAPRWKGRARDPALISM